MGYLDPEREDPLESFIEENRYVNTNYGTNFYVKRVRIKSEEDDEWMSAWDPREEKRREEEWRGEKKREERREENLTY